MEIELLSSTDWRRLRRIRLTALEDAPDSFGSTLGAAQALPDDAWRQQAEDLPTFIATVDGIDVGMVRARVNASTRFGLH